jgi:(p)ppGpp synthase/HD superfamily hydrolase
MDLNHLTSIKIASDDAAVAHRHQFRKDKSTPYFVHLARVAMLVSRYGGSPPGIIAAWLHDVQEDCEDGARIVEASLEKMPISLREKAGIQDMIDALTKNPSISNKRERLTDSLYRIRNAPPEATLVKLCDRIDNVIDARDRDERFLRIYLDLTGDVIEILRERAYRYEYGAALEELVAFVDQMRQ